jgi:eukaryotic-like serine/threonine-protein kinase
MSSESPSKPVHHIRDLFDALIDLDAFQREQHLATLDLPEAVERQLRKLLNTDPSDAPIPSAPAAQAIEQLRDDRGLAERLIGSRIGSFALIDLIGQGGSAVVFRAQRAVGDALQTVALKLMRTGLYSADAQRRFAREQTILAQLTHPNIAHLIEGGISESGVPFIAMELADGSPITHYADAQTMGLRERLELFLTLCRAVEAAHAVLVVHRDLKPSNIYVDAHGVLKVLDFGIAKLLGDDDAVATRTQAILLTPEYAAPEQFQPGPITIGADVYALGVMLGELLTGQLLGRGNTRNASTVAADSRDRPIPRGLPAPAALARRLRGDLDAIVATALAEEPGRRYRSAGLLADDIEHYLDGRPVRAHPPSRWYRTHKFVGRHRGAVGVTSVLVLAVLVSLVMAIWQMHIAQVQALLARQQAARASTVRNFVQGIFDPLGDGLPESSQPSLKALLATAEAQLSSAEDLGDEGRVDMLLLFARLNNKLGESKRAQALLEQATDLARTKLDGNKPLAIDILLHTARFALQENHLAVAEESLMAAEQLLGASPLQNAKAVDLYRDFGELAVLKGQPQRALSFKQKELGARIALYGVDSQRVAVGYNNLGYALEAVGRFDEAAQAYAQSYRTHLLSRAPESIEATIPLGNSGAAFMGAGRLRAAMEALTKATTVYAAVAGKTRNAHAIHASGRCAVAIAIDPEVAKDVCAEAIARNTDAHGNGSVDEALALRLESERLMLVGELFAAHAALSRSWLLLRDVEVPSWRGRTLITLGELDLIEGQNQKAIEDLQQGLLQFGDGYPPHLKIRGFAQLALACNEAAEAFCMPALTQLARVALDTDRYALNPLLLPAQVALARTELRAGHVDAAASRLASAITAAKLEIDPTHPRLLEAQLWLAVALRRSGECEESIALRAQSLRSDVQSSKSKLLQPALLAFEEKPCVRSN